MAQSWPKQKSNRQTFLHTDITALYIIYIEFSIHMNVYYMNLRAYVI